MPTDWREKAREEEDNREQYLELASLQFGSSVERAIRGLPPRDLLLLDRRMAGFTWQMIADELGTTEDAARQQWQRSKKRVRQALRRETFIEEILG